MSAEKNWQFEIEKYINFHDYSLNNTLLIAMQKPDATLVAGYTTWKKQFGRQVNKGEKGIHIPAPAPYKQKVEVDKTDPATGGFSAIRMVPHKRKSGKYCIRHLKSSVSSI